MSAFTRIPHIIATWNGDLARHIALLHEKYGEVVRISPDELSFINPSAWRDIYGHGSREGNGSAPPKHWGRYGTIPNGVPSLALMSEPAQHARTRKIFTPAFSDHALTQQTPLFTKYADQLVSVLKARSGSNVKLDLVRMYNYATFDVMGDLTFGESLHMLDNVEYDPWVTSIFKNIKTGAKLNMIYNHYPIAAYVLRKLFHGFIAKAQKFHTQHSETRVTKRLEKGRSADGVDLWDLVLQQQDKGNGLTRKEMDSNSSLFMIAGTETMATLLSGLTYLLLINPRSLKKLVQEIREAFASSDDISLEAIQALPYTNACIKEALRMYPPVPVGLPHLTPRDGSTICGHYIPPHVTVAAHHYAMYRSETVFKDPSKFIPERWTGDEKYAQDVRSAVQPFSVGPRDCLGKNMAFHEMRLLLTKMLFNFDITLCPESEGWLEKQDVYTFWEKLPLMVTLEDASHGQAE